MTDEALKRANDITKEINLVNKNLEEIEKVINYNGDWDKNAKIILSDGDRFRADLYDEILPITTKEIITIYKMKAQAHKEKLQKELESL